MWEHRLICDCCRKPIPVGEEWVGFDFGDFDIEEEIHLCDKCKDKLETYLKKALHQEEKNKKI